MSENIYLNIYLEDIKKNLEKSLLVQTEKNILIKEQNNLLKQLNQNLRILSMRL
ncbi:hypothetical protein P5E99_15780 [Clostridium perfringens]|nr:hypothetical protein [Clostridium perfringens]MDK0675386.1 hypothetical protein [Clostridium perfringens]MDM0464795.1 hypothetical protein [Clostridium perfringens]MDM0710614.1 hypothetical protein [Clostridium perfringens]HBI7095726.1 hypothetical protein [Clostridium perfringens]